MESEGAAHEPLFGFLFCQRYCCSVPTTSHRPSNRRPTCTVAWLSGVKATSVSCSLKGGACRITLLAVVVVVVAGTLDHPSHTMKRVHSGTWSAMAIFTRRSGPCPTTRREEDHCAWRMWYKSVMNRAVFTTS